MYWEKNDDADALYLKNQRQWISKYLRENLGGNLEIYKNMACLTLENDDCYGTVHPRDAMLPEAVLLVCQKIQDDLAIGKLEKTENERIFMSRKKFADLVHECRDKWLTGWSKEFREMDEKKLLETIVKYMEDWLMIRCENEQIVIYPVTGRLSGVYPDDFKGDVKK